jgi:hypothetical protein
MKSNYLSVIVAIAHFYLLVTRSPSPAKVMMNVSPQAGMLLMNFDLIHK